MFSKVILTAFATSVAASQAAPHHHNGGPTGGFLPIQHTVRVCNAYPFASPVDIKLNEEPFFTGLAFKGCQDFDNVGLRAGDKIKIETVLDHEVVTAGIFEFSDMPPFSATLLLVVKRHGSTLNAVAFDSHVFRMDDHAAQVAMIDAYQGEHNPSLRIMRHETGPESAPERLSWRSVHKVNSGWYDFAIKQLSNQVIEREFVALPKHSYVVMRTGMAKSQFAEDLVVFPHNTVEDLDLETGACEGKWYKPMAKLFGYCHDP